MKMMTVYMKNDVMIRPMSDSSHKSDGFDDERL